MQKNGNGGFSTKRIVFDGMLMALFFVLSSTSIRLGNTFKITFDSLPCILAAVAFGPIDGFIVGFFGEFIVQALSQYGLTQTTVLWMLAPAVRGLLPGIAAVIWKERMSISAILSKKSYFYFIVVAISSVVASICNTFALYVDSKLFGYYEYHMVFGVLGVRLTTGIISCIAMALIIMPVLKALKASNLIYAN